MNYKVPRIEGWGGENKPVLLVVIARGVAMGHLPTPHPQPKLHCYAIGRNGVNALFTNVSFKIVFYNQKCPTVTLNLNSRR